MYVTEFERKVNVQNHPFGWLRLENRLKKILIIQRQKM